jgi:[ribosomal protein S18]-alanine N-acetyltransferase
MTRRWALSMNNIEIIRMEPQYIKDVYNISRLCFKTPWSMDSLTTEFTNNANSRYFLAKVDGIIVAFGGMWIIIDEAHVTNIAVHPEYRGMGLGNMILNEMINNCKYELVIFITLEVRASNKIAQNLYSKHGFNVAGIRKRYYADTNEDAFIMNKSLS